MIQLGSGPTRVMNSAANKSAFFVCLVAAFTIAASSLYSTPITGTLHINSTSVVGVDENTTDFNYTGGTPSDTTRGTFLVLGDSTGSFAADAGGTGTIRSFNRSDVPLGTATSFSNFILLPSPIPNIEFVLTDLLAGTDGPCVAGATDCSPPMSPFNLANTPTGSFASLSIDVQAINLLTGEVSNGTGVFSEPIIGQSIQQVFATILAGGVEQHGYGAELAVTFTPTTTPEPPSMMFVAGGLLVLVSSIRRTISRIRKR